MSESVKVTKEAQNITTARAVLVEFDNIVLGGREIFFSSLKKILEANKITLTPVLFSKYVFKCTPREAVGNILNKSAGTSVSADKIADELEKAIREGLVAVSASAGSELKKLFKTAMEKNIKVGIVSSLSDDDIKNVLEKMNLSELAGMVIRGSNVYHASSTTDAWIKLARHASLSPVCCVAVVTSSTASRAVLAAGMRCVVVPDKYTAFQDFGGALYVVDSLAEITNDIFALLESSR